MIATWARCARLALLTCLAFVPLADASSFELATHQANVSAPLYVAPNGSDSGPCTAAAPCQTFGQAYRVAAPGQLVLVEAGAYPPQQLAVDPAKASSASRVVFQPAQGASVSVGQIDFGQAQLGIPGPQHVVVRDMSVGYLRAWDGSADLLWQNVRGRSFATINADHVAVLGGDYGPCLTPRDSGCTPLLSGTNLLIDGAVIHGQTLDPSTTEHVDGLFVRGCNQCTIRRTKFFGNMITNVRLQNCCDLPPNQNVTFVNNWFGSPLEGNGVTTRFDAVDIDNPVPGITFLYNTFAPGSGLGGGQLGTSDAPATFVGNLMGNAGCDPSAAYSHNLFIPFSPYTGTTPCGPTDRRVSSYGYVDAAAFDLHLAPNSPAIGAGDQTLCPSTDIDFRPRPHAVKCDAGADQRRDTLACRAVGKKRHVEVWVSGFWLKAQHGGKITPGACPKSSS